MTEDLEIKQEEDRLEKIQNEEEAQNNHENLQSDEEDDTEGYFLEPVKSSVNMAEKIAEANRKLLEEAEEDEDRPRKVQFSEELINFEPTYVSDDDYTESTRNSIISEEDVDLKFNQEETITENSSLDGNNGDKILISSQNTDLEDENEEILEVIEELVTDLPNNETLENSVELLNGKSKVLLVLLPKDQNSSCESIIGEEVVEDKTFVEEIKRPEKSKFVRPKSAKKSCEVSKISPNLNYSLERKEWHGRKIPGIKFKSKEENKEKKKLHENEIKAEAQGKVVKKVNLDLEGLRREELKRCGDSRPKSCATGKRNGQSVFRPKSAATTRTCFVLKTELPQYNGFRSEYGLSAEQLEERKRKTMELKHQKEQKKSKQRQEELKRKNENEETFQKWLLNKSKRPATSKPNRCVDTLTRSDMYIQTHASYAANHNVPYSVDYNLRKKKNFGKKNRAIIIEKLMNKITPNLKRSFNIYLGVKP